MGVEFTLNGRPAQLNAAGDQPLLWALRGEAGRLGVKFGCGAGLCGACTILVDGQQTRSCQTSVSAVEGKSVTTIEGLSGPVAQAVLNGWIKAQAPQCGYCQPGFVMATVSILTASASQSQRQVLEQLTNLCRCGTYDAIRLAVGYALEELRGNGSSKPADTNNISQQPAGGTR